MTLTFEVAFACHVTMRVLHASINMNTHTHTHTIIVHLTAARQDSFHIVTRYLS